MRRIGEFHKAIRVFRLDSDREVRLHKHAFIQPGDTIKAQSIRVSYGDVYYIIETLDGQAIVKTERIVLDISRGHSRERVDSYGESTNLLIFSKSQQDYARHKAAVDAESRRGVIALWNDTEFDCIIGDTGEEREYPGGGFDASRDGVAVANIRQFLVDGELKLPQIKDRLQINDIRFIIEEIRLDIAVCTFRLANEKRNPNY